VPDRSRRLLRYAIGAVEGIVIEVIIVIALGLAGLIIALTVTWIL
jgi:hypothetical protein